MLRSRDDMANGFGLKSKDRNSRQTNKREEKEKIIQKRKRKKERKIERQKAGQADRQTYNSCRIETQVRENRQRGVSHYEMFILIY